jgi:hypothetical protein
MSAKVRVCEICKEPIDSERIEVLPETRLCSEHAKMIARHGGEFTMTYTRERLGKPGSLKKNYGGITPEKMRNTTAIARLRQELAERTKRDPGEGDA